MGEGGPGVRAVKSVAKGSLGVASEAFSRFVLAMPVEASPDGGGRLRGVLVGGVGGVAIFVATASLGFTGSPSPSLSVTRHHQTVAGQAMTLQSLGSMSLVYFHFTFFAGGGCKATILSISFASSYADVRAYLLKQGSYVLTCLRLALALCANNCNTHCVILSYISCR